MTITIHDTEYAEADVPVELAKEALLIQDACNLSGLVFSFAREMQQLCDHPRCTGTAWRNHHPVVVLWLSKLDSLCTGDCGDTDAFFGAYELCQKVVQAHDLAEMQKVVDAKARISA